MFWVRGAVKVFLILKSISSMRMGPWKTRGGLSPEQGQQEGLEGFYRKPNCRHLLRKLFTGSAFIAGSRAKFSQTVRTFSVSPSFAPAAS